MSVRNSLEPFNKLKTFFEQKGPFDCLLIPHLALNNNNRIDILIYGLKKMNEGTN